MEKTDLDKAISLLNEKLDLLSSYNKKLLSDNSALSKELQSLKSQNSEQLREIETLRKRVDTQHLAGSFAKSMGGKREAHYIVKTILREIDDCIALINK